LSWCVGVYDQFHNTMRQSNILYATSNMRRTKDIYDTKLYRIFYEII